MYHVEVPEVQADLAELLRRVLSGEEVIISQAEAFSSYVLQSAPKN